VCCLGQVTHEMQRLAERFDKEMHDARSGDASSHSEIAATGT
jgi:hypothetical protein